MRLIKPYLRDRALAYAKEWAFSRNPLFYDYTGIGGNCTNFVSQCLYAGSCEMNFTPVYGWYYLSSEERTAAWTGVEYLYNFLIGNRGVGPFGREVSAGELATGDVIQLAREDGVFYHTLLVSGFEGDTYLVAAQSDDAFDRPLNSYNYATARYIHIDGVGVEWTPPPDCYESLLNGTAIEAADRFPTPDTPSEPSTPAPTPSPEIPPEEPPAEEGEEGIVPENAVGDTE